LGVDLGLFEQELELFGPEHTLKSSFLLAIGVLRDIEPLGYVFLMEVTVFSDRLKPIKETRRKPLLSPLPSSDKYIRLSHIRNLFCEN
jgi:hypothetical protein